MMEKQQIVILGTMMLGLLLLSFYVVAITKFDYFVFDKSEVSLGRSCSYYTIKNPTLFNITVSGANLPKIIKYTQNAGAIANNADWQIYAPVERDRGYYDTICSNKTKTGNKTFVESNCTTEYRTEKYPSLDWVDIASLSDIKIAKLESWQVRFCADHSFNRSSDGSARVSIDHVPGFLGESYDEFAWWNTTFNYRRNITVTENNGTTLSNYPIRIVLNNTNFNMSQVMSNCSDLRFIYNGSATELNYWIETCRGSRINQTIVWVNVTTLPANSNTTIEVYYNTSVATSASDGKKVFEAFDDFNRADNTAVGGTPSWIEDEVGDWAAEINNSRLRIKANSNHQGDPDTQYDLKNIVGADVVGRSAFVTYCGVGTSNRQEFGIGYGAPRTAIFYLSVDSNFTFWNYDAGTPGFNRFTRRIGAGPNEVQGDDATFYNGSCFGTEFHLQNVSTNSMTRFKYWLNTTDMPTAYRFNTTVGAAFADDRLNFRYGLRATMENSGPLESYFDNFFVARKILPEPTLTFRSQEQSTSVPITTLETPVNNTQQYGNASITYNFNVTDDDNSTLFNASLLFESVVINTTTDVVNNARINFSYRRLTDCVLCSWSAQSSDGTNTGASSSNTISLDVIPYNTSLARVSGTYLDNQTFGIDVNFNLTLTNVLDHTGNCNVSIDNGAWSSMTSNASRGMFNFSTTQTFGSKTLNVSCTNTNSTALNSTFSVFVADATPPIVTVNSPANNTQENAATRVINVTFVDNRTISNANVTFWNGSANANYNISLSTNVTSAIPLVADTVHRWNVTAIDNESNRNTTRTFILIEDSTAPNLVSANVPASGTQGTSITLRWNVTDNMDAYASISSVTAEIQQPSGSRTNYTLTSEISTQYNYKLDFILATSGTYTVTNIYSQDVAGNSRTNATTNNIESITLPASEGGGGGGGGSLTIIQPVVNASSFKAKPSRIESYRFYAPFGETIKTWDHPLETTKPVKTCSLTNTQDFRCEITASGVLITSIASNDALQAFILRTGAVLESNDGDLLIVPTTVRVLNVGGYIKIPFKMKSPILHPLWVKTDDDGNLLGIRYVPPILSVIGLSLFIQVIKWLSGWSARRSVRTF